MATQEELKDVEKNEEIVEKLMDEAKGKPKEASE